MFQWSPSSRERARLSSSWEAAESWSPSAVAAQARSHAQVSAGVALQVAPHQRLALFDEGPARRSSKPPRITAEPRLLRASAAPDSVPELPVKGHGLFEGRYCRSVVPLEVQDPTEPNERPGPDGGEPSGVSLQRRPQPPFALPETLDVPEAPRRRHQPQPQPGALVLTTARLQRPRDRAPEVPDLGPEPSEPLSLIRSQQLGFGLLGEGQVVPRVQPADLLFLAGLNEAFQSVLPDRLQHPVAHCATPLPPRPPRATCPPDPRAGPVLSASKPAPPPRPPRPPPA